MILNRRAIKAVEARPSASRASLLRKREIRGRNARPGICRGVIREHFQSRHAIFYLSAGTCRPSARDLFVSIPDAASPPPPSSRTSCRSSSRAASPFSVLDPEEQELCERQKSRASASSCARAMARGAYSAGGGGKPSFISLTNSGLLRLPNSTRAALTEERKEWPTLSSLMRATLRFIRALSLSLSLEMVLSTLQRGGRTADESGR